MTNLEVIHSYSVWITPDEWNVFIHCFALLGLWPTGPSFTADIEGNTDLVPDIIVSVKSLFYRFMSSLVGKFSPAHCLVQDRSYGRNIGKFVVLGTAIDHYRITHTAWQCSKNDYILKSQNIWRYCNRCARCNLKFCNEYIAEANAINGHPSFTVFVRTSLMEIWKVNCTKCVQNNTFGNRSCLRKTSLPTKWFMHTGVILPPWGGNMVRLSYKMYTMVEVWS